MKILLPTDGSVAANEAVAFVRSLAENTPVDVVVLMASNAPVQQSLQRIGLNSKTSTFRRFWRKPGVPWKRTADRSRSFLKRDQSSIAFWNTPNNQPWI